MDSEKPLILVVNDDGFESPGLIELAHQVRSLGDILIVAPQEKHSGASRPHPYSTSYRGTGEIIAKEIELSPGDTITGFAVNGTPNAAAVHGIFELSKGRKPSLCVSGINFGENIGTGIYASGTIAAAFEAADRGIPSIAISQQLPEIGIRPKEFDGLRKMFSLAGKTAAKIANEILSNGQDRNAGLCLNINVPASVTKRTAIVYTDLTTERLWEWLPLEREDISKPASLQMGPIANPKFPKGSDAFELYGNGNITVTALTSNMQDRCFDSSGLTF